MHNIVCRDVPPTCCEACSPSQASAVALLQKLTVDKCGDV